MRGLPVAGGMITPQVQRNYVIHRGRSPLRNFRRSVHRLEAQLADPAVLLVHLVASALRDLAALLQGASPSPSFSLQAHGRAVLRWDAREETRELVTATVAATRHEDPPTSGSASCRRKLSFRCGPTTEILVPSFVSRQPVSLDPLLRVSFPAALPAHRVVAPASRIAPANFGPTPHAVEPRAAVTGLHRPAVLGGVLPGPFRVLLVDVPALTLRGPTLDALAVGHLDTAVRAGQQRDGRGAHSMIVPYFATFCVGHPA